MRLTSLSRPAREPAAADRASRAALPSGRSAAVTRRDLRLDFLRGIALFLIFIDHIPDNALSYFTIQAVGFSDAAEIFIFVSGYTAALVYGRAWRDRGPLVATVKILHRVWQLYVAHIFVFLLYTALVAFSALTLHSARFGQELRVAKFFSEPYVAVIRVLELRFQPTFLDILPLYIVLLFSFPLVLLLIRRHPLWALIPSLLVYLAVQLFGFSLLGYPGYRPWFFNPLAWQLLFVIGAICGYSRSPPSGGNTHPHLAAALRRLVIPAVIVCAAAALIRLSWTLHNFWGSVPALLLDRLWPIDKSNLAPVRLVHFLALAVLAACLISPDARFLRWPSIQPVIRCGQFSLQIFCLGILLSVVGHFVFEEWSDSLPTQLATNAMGILVMIGTAQLISWYRAIDRATERA